MRAALCDLLGATVRLSKDVSGSPAWEEPLASSQAGKELVAEEAARPHPQTGSWPWLLTLRFARWAMLTAVEEARSMAVLVADETSTSQGVDVLCRAVLEASSLAWWMLDPGIDAQRRIARMFLYRLNGAQEADKAKKALAVGSGGPTTDYWETATQVQAEIHDYGFTLSQDRRNLTRGPTSESRPGYGERVAELMCSVWSSEVPEFAYRFLSAVPHAEVLGLARGLIVSPCGADDLRPDPFWVWFDAYVTIGAVALSCHRAADFLGLDEVSAGLKDWVGTAQSDLLSVRP